MTKRISPPRSRWTEEKTMARIAYKDWVAGDDLSNEAAKAAFAEIEKVLKTEKINLLKRGHAGDEAARKRVTAIIKKHCDRCAPKRAAAKDAAPKSATAKKDAAPKSATAKKDAAPKSSPAKKDAAPKSSPAKKPPTKDAAPASGTAKKQATKDASPKSSPAKKTAAKDAAPGSGATRKAATKDAAPKSGAAEAAKPKKTKEEREKNKKLREQLREKTTELRDKLAELRVTCPGRQADVVREATATVAAAKAMARISPEVRAAEAELKAALESILGYKEAKARIAAAEQAEPVKAARRHVAEVKAEQIDAADKAVVERAERDPRVVAAKKAVKDARSPKELDEAHRKLHAARSLCRDGQRALHVTYDPQIAGLRAQLPKPGKRTALEVFEETVAQSPPTVHSRRAS
jgi:hypothetical protein